MTIALARPTAAITAPEFAATEMLAQLEHLQADLEQPDLALEDVLRARTTAETLRAFAVAAVAGKVAVLRAAELRIIAERRAGTLLLQILETTPIAPDRYARRRNLIGVPMDSQLHLPKNLLAELGIRGTDSSKWQLLARIPQSEFDQRLAASRSAGRMPSISSFLRAAHQFARTKSGRSVTPTSRALEKVLKILRDIKALRTRQEVSYARQIVAITETWPAEVQDAVPRRTDWQAPREVTCLLCGRPRPASCPPRCGVCGGAWMTI